jgi:hypothetical protein
MSYCNMALSNARLALALALALLRPRAIAFALNASLAPAQSFAFAAHLEMDKARSECRPWKDRASNTSSPALTAVSIALIGVMILTAWEALGVRALLRHLIFGHGGQGSWTQVQPVNMVGNVPQQLRLAKHTTRPKLRLVLCGKIGCRRLDACRSPNRPPLGGTSTQRKPSSSGLPFWCAPVCGDLAIGRALLCGASPPTHNRFCANLGWLL